MRFSVLRSKAVSRSIRDKHHQPPIVNYLPTTSQWENQNSMFGTQVDCFFPTFKGSKYGSSLISSVKLYRNDLEGKQKLLRVSGRFQLPRVKLQ